MNLKDIPDKIYQFEHATVIYKAELSVATGKVMPSLYVQAIDAYRYQRELSVSLRWRPGDSKSLFWNMHAYQHALRRNEMELTPARAIGFIRRFIELCELFPSLLFNKTGEHTTDTARPRHEGFVHLHDQLLNGSIPRDLA